MTIYNLSRSSATGNGHLKHCATVKNHTPILSNSRASLRLLLISGIIAMYMCPINLHVVTSYKYIYELSRALSCNLVCNKDGGEIAFDSALYNTSIVTI